MYCLGDLVGFLADMKGEVESAGADLLPHRFGDTLREVRILKVELKSALQLADRLLLCFPLRKHVNVDATGDEIFLSLGDLAKNDASLALGHAPLLLLLILLIDIPSSF
jgi:hypothetical protein